MYKYIIYANNGLCCGGGVAENIDMIYNRLLPNEEAIVLVNETKVARIIKEA